ncbi:MAG: hypothetical protein JXQ73_16245 [Phycisphaerae bacterium]|nr:hypothetical protein [Phycisphaerae bacterium]
MELAELSALAKRHYAGEVSEEELARTLRSISTSISFASAMASFESLYGPPPPTWRNASVGIQAIDASQPCLEYAKIHLVKWLFARSEDFERLNRMYFPEHPISVLRLGNGRFGVIDGHHRLWQAGVIFGPSATVFVRVVSSENPLLLTSVRDGIRRVAELNSSAELRRLPIRDMPNATKLLQLAEGLANPRWLLAGPWPAKGPLSGLSGSSDGS